MPLRILFALTILVFAWSGIAPADPFTWFLEVLPVFIAVPVLWFTRNRFPLPRFLYAVIALHAIILMVGGHYTYAEVPLFNWIRDAWGLSRNHYDRLGHFFQGATPALLTREILRRTTLIHRGKMLTFLCLCVPLAFSASYEFMEWWVSLATGSAGDAFLGTQGDVWDTQWDMFMALLGASTMQIIFSNYQEQQLDKLK
jgi:putative membrane protein